MNVDEAVKYFQETAVAMFLHEIHPCINSSSFPRNKNTSLHPYSQARKQEQEVVEVEDAPDKKQEEKASFRFQDITSTALGQSRQHVTCYS